MTFLSSLTMKGYRTLDGLDHSAATDFPHEEPIMKFLVNS